MNRTMVRVFFLICSWYELGFAELVSLPEGCLAPQLKASCLVGSMGETESLILSSKQLVLDRESTLELSPEKQIRLIKGGLWLKGSSSSILTPYATVYCEPCVLHLVMKKSGVRDQMELQVFKGKANIVNPHEKDLTIPLFAGFEIWFSGRNSLGGWEFGIPRALDFETVINSYASLPKKNAQLLKIDFKKLADDWHRSLDESRALNKNIIERVLASQAEEEARQKAEVQRRKAEETRLRNLLREKNYLDIE